MADYYLKSGNNADWAATTVKGVGDRVVASRAATAARKVRVFECTTGGTTDGSEPAWNTTVGGTTADGTVVWTTRAPTTWANAHRYLDHMLHTNVSGSTVGAGDRVFVSNAHTEAITGNSLLTANTLATKDNPYQVLCVSDDTAEPPTTLATGASIGCTGTYSLRSHTGYFYGIEFRCGVGQTSTNEIRIDGTASENSWLRFENCILDLASTGGASLVRTGEGSGPAAAGTAMQTYLINCEVQIGASGATAVQIQSGIFTWLGGSITGTAPTNILGIPNGNARKAYISGVDFSLGGTNLIGIGTSPGQDADDVTVVDCRLHASTSLFTSLRPTNPDTWFRIINCSSGSENYKFAARTYYGDIDHETTLVRTGGASDGATPLSWKLVTTSVAKRTQPLYSPWMFLWNEATSSKTLTVEILHDSATALKDNEVWVEVLYLGSSGQPQATLIRDVSNVLAAGADQTSSSVTWTTTGMSNPNKQKLEVTFTPQMKGLFRVRVALAKLSKTIYVDPLLTAA